MIKFDADPVKYVVLMIASTLLAGNASLPDTPAGAGTLLDGGGAVGWLNSAPLNCDSLMGKVTLVEYWTYTGINSLRPLPYVKSWAEEYKDAGFVVICVAHG